MRNCLFNEASMWVYENANKKGALNMTAASFNSSMISSYHLPTNYPRTVFFFLRTATRWLHRLRFHPTSHKKGIYLYFISYVYIYIYQECVWMGRVQGCVVIQEGYLKKKLDNLQSNHLPPPPCSDERALPHCRCQAEKEASHDLP